LSSVNKAILVGRLGRDPEVRYTGSGQAVANLSLATAERFKDKQGEYQERTEWHRITAWGRLAEIVQQYTHKGSMIYVEGRIETRKYEKDGVERYSTEIVAQSIQLLGSKGDNGSPASGQESDAAEPAAETETDDIPF